MNAPTEGLRLSPQQMSLWLQHAEVARAEIPLHGERPLAQWSAAVAAVVARHDALRTRYVRARHVSTPFQVIEHAGWYRFEAVERERAPAMFEEINESGPRFTLVGDAPRRRLIVELAGLSVDRTGLWLVLADLARQVTRGADGEALGYPDVSEWLLGLASSPEAGAADAFWRACELDAAQDLQLPFARFAPLGRATICAAQCLSADAAAHIDALADAQQCEVQDVMLGGLLAVLAQFGLGRAIHFGWEFAGRSDASLEKVVGPLAQVVPVCVDASQETTWSQLIAQARDARLEAQRWLEYYDASRLPMTPKFRLQFAFMDVPALDADSGLLPESATVAVTADPCTLRLRVERTGARMQLCLEACPQAFDSRAAGLILRALVAGVGAAQADGRLHQLAHLLPEREPAVLGEAREHAAPLVPTVVELLANAARTHAGFPALLQGEESFSYAQMAAVVASAAGRLRAAGVQRGDLVPVIAARSAAQLLCCHAVMRCGAAFVPLDPATPPARLQAILDDCQPRLLLVERSAESSPGATPERTLTALLGPVEGESSGEDFTAPPLLLPAYVIYTSGTTGSPKGVVVSHGALAHYVAGIAAPLEIEPGTILSTFASVAADLGYTALFGALARAAAVRIIPAALAEDPDALAVHLRAHPVDVLKIVPSHLRVLLASISGGDAGVLLPRRLLVLGGERADRALLQTLAQLRPGLKVINHYGPTETTVGVLTGPLQADAPILIGAPLRHVCVCVLDDDLRPVSPGVEGRLFIAGDSLANGYLRRPGETALRFVPSLCGGAGERMYDSGDRVREHPDGRLEFLGRRDAQVKIRGHRVELPDIESQIRALPDIREAACVALAGEQTTQIAAYLVCAAERFRPGALRAELAQRLPEALLPSFWTRMDALPLTPSGKVDRLRLPPPAPDESSAAVAARTGQEQALTLIWREVLGREQVGVHDDFFELGGDSIMAIQVAGRARRHDMVISAADIFALRTIAQLAEKARQSAGPTDHAPASGESALTPIQQRLIDNLGGDFRQYNHSRLFTIQAPFDVDAIHEAVRLLVQRHDVLRSRFEQRDGQWLQVYGAPDAAQHVPFELRRPSMEDRAAIDAWLLEECTLVQASLDPMLGLVFRVVVFENPAGVPSRALFAIHHLVVDVVSWGILSEDFHSIYSALKAGAVPAAAPRTSSFQDWSACLQAHAQSDGLAQEARQWRQALDAGTFELAVDRQAPAAANTVGGARYVETLLDQASTAQLQDVYGRGQDDATLFQALVGAFVDALRTVGTGPAVVIELESHGRDHPFAALDILHTVGWFTSRYPLAVPVDEKADLPAVLDRVRASMQAVPNGGMGFGILRFLAPAAGREHGIDRVALPEVSFNFMGHMRSAAGGTEALLTAGRAPPAERAASQPREHLIAANALIVEDCLRTQISYSSAHFDADTIERLARDFAARLRQLASDQRAQPAIGAAALRLAGLRDERELEDWLQRHLPGQAVNAEDLYPLSPLQQGMLFHSAVAPSSGEYVLQLVARLRGRIDAAAMRRAFAALVDAHPVLRTCFGDLQGERPLQLVVRDVQPEFETHDWSTLEAARREARLVELLAADRRRGFDPARPSLMRVFLIREADDDYRLIWSRHHAIVDGWSSSILLSEVFESYHACARGETPRASARPPYSRYIHWLNEHRNAPREAAEQAFWKDYLFGVPLPTPGLRDRENAAAGEFARNTSAELDAQIHAALRERGRTWRTTLNIVTQAAWGFVLARLAGRSDVVFGSIVSGRPEEMPQVERIVGPFINTQPVRFSTGDLVAQNCAGTLHRLQTQRERHAHTPLREIRRLAQLRGDNPLFDSLFIFENYQVERSASDIEQPGLQITAAQTLDRTHYPVTLYVLPAEALRVRLSFDPARVSEQLAASLLESFRATLLELARSGEFPDAQTRLPVQAAAAARHLLVAGTFTVDPLAATLEFWSRYTGNGGHIEIVPHDQVAQALLAAAQVPAAECAAGALVFIRWEDWLRGVPAAQAHERLEEVLRDFISAARVFAELPNVTVQIVLCPSPGGETPLLSAMAERLRGFAAAYPNVGVWDGQAIFERYSVTRHEDLHSDALARIPFTAQACAALATDAFRRHRAAVSAPYKVLVLDCDNTLWGGVCAEDGPAALDVAGPYEAIRRFALEQKRRGVLLCLCSANEEADVREVFATRDLGMRWEDFAATCVNWERKSDNLRQIARLLDLGVDSLVLLDDDPAQCLAVRTLVPEVAVVQLPEDVAEIADFLAHLWMFDGASSRDRTQMYAQHAQRETARGSATSLAGLIEMLNVEAEHAGLGAGDVERVAELSVRTNQFNVGLNRYDAQALREMLSRPGVHGMVTRVRDRYGDYGNVGAVLYRVDDHTVTVIDWWLSCRALARGVEHGMLRALAARAQGAGASRLRMTVATGPRNTPARQFHARIFEDAVGSVPLAPLLSLMPADESPAWKAEEGTAPPTPAPVAPPFAAIAHDLRTAAAIEAAARRMRRETATGPAPFVAARGATEQMIARQFAEVLGTASVGAHDSFFALGGDSVSAVRLVARLRDQLQMEIPLMAVFERERVNDLAARIDLMLAAAGRVPQDRHGAAMTEGAL